MGHRQEPRVELNWPATLCGVDARGRSFLQCVTIRNISGRGVLLDSSECPAKVGETVVLRCGKHHGRFLVMWLDRDRQLVGLQHVLASTLFWGLDLPAGPDHYCRERSVTRRDGRRFTAELPVELRINAKVPLWSTTANVSEGGCFVRMLNGAPLFTRVDIAVWIDSSKFWAEGMVVSSINGEGIGIKFLSMSEEARLRLRDAIETAEEVDDRREAGEPITVWESEAQADSVEVSVLTEIGSD